MKLTAVLAAVLATTAVALDLSGFDEAIRKDPKNHMAYYKRATANLAAGRDPQALGDLTAVLDLDPGFSAARFYRARLYLRTGNWAKCLADAEQCTDERAAALVDEAKLAEAFARAAESDQQAGEFNDCISSASEALKLAPRAIAVRKLRYHCAMSLGEVPSAVADLQEIVAQDKSDTKSTTRLVKILYLVDNHRDVALKQVRRCVSYDPDAKDCAAASKFLRSLEKKLAGNPLKISYKEIETLVFAECDALGLPRESAENSALLDELRHRRCEAFADAEKWDRAARVCARVRDTDPDFQPAALVQAHLERQAGNPLAALRLLDPFVHHATADPRIMKLYNDITAEMQVPKREAPAKSLYKVLGVSERADKQEIKKAYRELSKKYHPDKYRGDDLSPDEVMAKMQEINGAYEVLSNEDSRKDYDMSRAGGGGWQPQQPPQQHQQGRPAGQPFGGGKRRDDSAQAEFIRRFAANWGGQRDFKFSF